MNSETWRKCSTCKTDIGFGQKYYVCNVSTCNARRTGFVFCKVDCWDAHVPLMRHRDAWAEDRRAPSRAEYERELAEEARKQAEAEAAEPRRRIVGQAPSGAPAPLTLSTKDVPEEVLVVVSKLKAYVRARSGMNTSDAVMEVLSDKLRQLCDEAIHHAAADGRKTIMERDFK